MIESFQLAIPEAARVPHLDQYFGVWAVHEPVFRAGVQRVASLDLALHLRNEIPAAKAAAAEQRMYDVSGGVAIIQLEGVLMKHTSSFDNNSSTVLARRKIRQAIADEGVRAILLQIDSPGGTVAGTRDLAEEVAKAAKAKPTYAYIEDLGASAAYWIASQASKVFANATGLVGSIGTYGVLEDSSGAAQQQGVVVHVVKAGDFKGMGAEGAPITLEHLAEYQRIVDELNDHFIRGVAAGRKMTLARTKELADGRVQVGQAAAEAGLIDAVQTFDETLAQLSKKGKTMSQATYQEIKAECLGADAEFVVGQLDKGATAVEARQAWMAEQNRRVEAARQEAAAVKAAGTKPGVSPQLDRTHAAASADGEPVADFNTRVEAKIKGGMSRARAVSAVAKEAPELHTAMIQAANHTAGNERGLAISRFA